MNLSRKTKLSLPAMLMVLALVLMSSNCKKDDPVAPDPKITSITDSTFIGEEITIVGENFSTDFAKTKVYFGEKEVAATGGDATTIKTKVPTGLDFKEYMVKAKIGEKFTVNEIEFTVRNPADTVTPPEKLVFTDFNPKSGIKGTSIIIEGKNFDKNVEVRINGEKQTDVTYDSETQITVKVAAKSGTGKVELQRGDDKMSKTDLFLYEYTGSDVKAFCNYRGTDIVALDDGSAYICHSDGLIKVASNGVDTVMLDDKDFLSTVPQGLFLAQDGTLYITDQNGRILMRDKDKTDSEGLDTLINLDTPNSDLKTDRVWNITGDNEGKLYVTTTDPEIIIVDISAKTAKAYASIPGDDTYGIAYKNDSLYITTTKGLVRMHKDGKSYTYLKEFANTAEGKFSQCGLTLVPNGDIFITGGDKQNLYKFSKNAGVTEFITKDKLGINSNILGVHYIDGMLYIAGGAGSKKVILE